MSTAPGTVVIELASSSLADNPALHAAIAAPLALIGLAVYLVRRRRRASHELHDDHDQHGSGSGNPPDRERRT